MDARRGDPPTADRQRRVGVLTFHNTTNYGATLQTLGLLRALARRGFAAEVIDYRPSTAAAYYRTKFTERDAPAKILKALRFRAFMRRHLTLSSRSCSSAADLSGVADGRYDAVIVGSDQVWNVNDKIRPFDSSFYLRFIGEDGIRRISYAASFGDAFPLEPVRERISEGLMHLDQISVRDEHSRDLVRLISGRDASLVADPTLLVELSDLEEPPRLNGPFAVYYGTDAQGLGGAKSAQWCREQKLPMYSLGYRGPAGSYTRIAIGPGQWMGFLRSAAMIATSTFHGAVFAAKMGRPFVVIAREWNALKITDFARRVGLVHRVFEAGQCPNTLPAELWRNDDVVGAREKLEHLRTDSDRFLDEALALIPNSATVR